MGWFEKAVTVRLLTLGAARRRMLAGSVRAGAALSIEAGAYHLHVCRGRHHRCAGARRRAAISEIWGQQVVVENRAGANTQIGAEHVAKSAGDGYTLMVTSEGTFVMNPSLYDKLPYDAARDFIPITTLVELKQVLIVSPKVPASNIRELIEFARKASRRTDLRDDRAWLILASQYGDAPEHGAGEDHRRALSRRVAGTDRHARRPYRHDLRRIRYRCRSIPRRRIENPRGVEPHPRRRAARPADDRRRRPAGLRRHVLVRAVCPARHAAGRDRENSHRRREGFDNEAFRKGFLEPNMLEPNIIAPDVFARSINDGRERWGKIIRAAGLKGN